MRMVKPGLAIVLVLSAALAGSGFSSARAFATSEAPTGDPARNLMASRKRVKRPADQVAKDVPEVEYQERLSRIRQSANEGNFQDLIKEGDEILDIWGTIGGERFARLTLEVINGLGLSRISDKNPAARDMREKYAIAALAVSESYGIESELSLVGQVRYFAFDSSLSAAEEAEKLRHGSKLWLRLLARIESERDPSVNLDPHQSLPDTLITPVELRMVEIEDPLAAARLRTAEAEHQEKLKKISYQFQLQSLSEIAERNGPRFLANVYSRPPFSREELEVLLSEYPIAESLRKRILQARDDLAVKAAQ